jgi:hypothetical protein
MTQRQISKAKGFQLATALAALKRLRDEDGPKRFLVADEVGLGKTVVARTIISELMKGRRSPLVVFYVCSNLNIANQNRRKLLEILESDEEQKRAASKADRLTLAASPTNRPTHERYHLYTLTPETSIPLYRGRGGFGKAEERAFIFQILTKRFPSLDSTLVSDFFRWRASKKTWKSMLNRFENIPGILALQTEFLDVLSNEGWNFPKVDSDSIYNAIESEARTHLLGRFRNALALTAMREIQPELIIFDEFQKFRAVLIDPPDRIGDRLTRSIRGTGKRSDPGVLLLSATPYRLYSTRHDEAAGRSHHQDFFELLCFLFGTARKDLTDLEIALRDFRDLMVADAPDFERLRELQDKLQLRLKLVMSRTERPEDANSVKTPVRSQAELIPDDLKVFKHWVRRLKGKGKQTFDGHGLISYAVPYWSSIPLPVQTMGRGYVAWRKAERKSRPWDEPSLRQVQRDRLNAPKSWPHPQFRSLQQIADPSRLMLPWVAPSAPWWDLDGPWSNPEARKGKLLIFSRFKAVPPAIASLLSFDLETRFRNALKQSYLKAGKAQPLQLKADRPTLLALFFPSPIFIALTDPLKDKPKNLLDVRQSMRRQVADVIKNYLGLRIRKSGERRALWKLLPALETIRSWVEVDDGTRPSPQDIATAWRRVGAAQAQVMRDVLSEWNVFAREGIEEITQGEVAALADFALSGPGVVVGRALYRFDPTCISSACYPSLLDLSWNGLRVYLNRSLFHAVLTRRKQTYIEAIPEAMVAGNLESVLDEHLWIVSQLDADGVKHFTKDLKIALSLHEGRHRLHEPGKKDGFGLRCHAAMPFADAKMEKSDGGLEGKIRTDELRRSFNSPFFPHVLATTSLGQEGLDFHVWCRQLLHWDLCSSPLDLEQREGRIQRFGGYSVRRALANKFKHFAISTTSESESPWKSIASLAEEECGTDLSGMSPWWFYPDDEVDRLFIHLPHSRQINRFTELSRQRLLYRLALGQPHQQDFIESISRLPPDGRQNFMLNLSAWPTCKL